MEPTAFSPFPVGGFCFSHLPPTFYSPYYTQPASQQLFILHTPIRGRYYGVLGASNQLITWILVILYHTPALSFFPSPIQHTRFEVSRAFLVGLKGAYTYQGTDGRS